MNFGNFFRHLSLVFASYLGLLGIPMPLPVPPMPEDPVLMQVAPADAALFVEWFGRGEASADPSNRTERLAAEPEVHRAIAKLVSSCRSAIEHQAARNQNIASALVIFDKLLILAERPGCIFVTDVKPLGGGLVVQVGADAKEFSAAINKALAELLPEESPRASKVIAGVTFDTMALGGRMQFVAWAAIDDYFVVTIGEAASKQVVAGIRDQHAGLNGNAAVQNLLAGSKVDRPMLRTFAAIDKIVAQVPWAETFWGPLGISQATAALAESGLEGDGFVSRTQLVIAKPAGVLGNLRGRPLSQDDLALIPGDATTAIALRLTEGTLEQSALQIAASFTGRDPTQHWQRFIAQGQSQIDVDVSADLVAHLDDCVVAWNSPQQGGLGFTAATVSVPLRDAKAFGENLATMWNTLTERAPNKEKALAKGDRIRRYGGYLDSFVHDGVKAWWMDHISSDMPFGISWASTDKHGLVAMQPQPLRSAIDASKLPNFDSALVRKRVVARRGEATAMLYFDAAGLLQQGYGALLVGLQMVSYEWHSEGFAFDLCDVPRLESLVPHLGAELTVLEATPDGFRVTRRGSLPVFDALLISCGAACMLAQN
ncbi:MAG: hypothetical protein ACJAYX_004123 [Planctomycetota bacterium]|jgi:hypothetical protein